MGFILNSYFLDNAVRLLRHNWGGGGTQLLSQELFALLSGIQRPVEQVTTRDPNGNPTQFPVLDLPHIDPFQFDFDIPQSPAIDPPVVTQPQQPPTNPNDPSQPPADPQPTEASQTITHRNSFPGQILSRSGNTYQVRLKLNGSDSSQDRTVTATCIDAALDAAVGEWVVVFMIARYTTTVTQTPTQTSGDLQATNVEYVFVPPGSSSGFAITTSRISGRADPADPRSELGSGLAVLRVFQNGQLVDGDTVTIYNTVSGSISANRLIQWKAVGGIKVVDVDDCGATNTT